MLHQITEAFMAMLASVPALFTEPGSPNFFMVRAMFGLIAIVLIVYLIAMRPFRSAIASCWLKVSHFFGRKP
jgi:hypothetical protein